MKARTYSTTGVAAGALLAAVVLVAFGGNDDGAGPARPIRELAQARQIAEREASRSAVAMPTLAAARRAGGTALR